MPYKAPNLTKKPSVQHPPVLPYRVPSNQPKQGLRLSRSNAKTFMRLYRAGLGISNQQLKKLCPDAFPGDNDIDVD